ncbi:MAG: M23 family metallopeptidase [Lachnospiraceae bacterium]|nr:M23 family metallopeptidase [Lachnospiraceae bacterium]
MRRRRRRSFSKERFLMIASSVLVLGSLTATGLWLGRNNSRQDDGYVVDLSAIENNTAAGSMQEEGAQLAENVTGGASLADDLDYDPYFQETNSQKVENPDQSESESMSEGADQAQGNKAKGTEEEKKKEEPSPEPSGGDIKEDEESQEGTPALSTAMQPALTFSDSDTLIWPIVGNILVNYSMDKTVYFSTLQQYKYNPAIIIQANEGDLITSASAGKVKSVFKDPQIGNAVVMELGGGYEATYGQLTNILVSEGSYVAAGDIIAEVAAPTKYFSVEGTNVYFKLTKDGTPVNPMMKLN